MWDPLAPRLAAEIIAVVYDVVIARIRKAWKHRFRFLRSKQRELRRCVAPGSLWSLIVAEQVRMLMVELEPYFMARADQNRRYGLPPGSAYRALPLCARPRV